MTTVLQVLLCCSAYTGCSSSRPASLVPYSRRIAQISSYYQKESKVIGAYDSIMLAMVVVLTVLLLLTEPNHLSFTTGLIVGMLLIQVFYHRFNQVLPVDKAPPALVTPISSTPMPSRPSRAWPGAKSCSCRCCFWGRSLRLAKIC